MNPSAELGHIVYYVSDLNKALHFYHETLGLQLTGRLFNGRAAALTSGRTHHELLLIEVGQAPGPVRGKRIGLYHVGWKIGEGLDSLRQMKQRLEAQGYAVAAAVDHGITFSLYLHDPDGNEVELYADNSAFDWRQDNSWLHLSPQPLSL